MGVAETKERAAADDENQALCMVARNLIEKESRERRKAAEELAASHLELHSHVQNESTSRGLHGASLEEQLLNHTKGRALDKDERLKEQEVSTSELVNWRTGWSVLCWMLGCNTRQRGR